MASDVPFQFLDGPGAVPPGAKGTRVAATISLKRELCKTIIEGLGAPYGGHNWDALYDWLTSLWWINEREVWILHDGVPALSEADLRTYIDLLAQAVDDWKGDPIHALTVTFPIDCKSAVLRLIKPPMETRP